MSPSHRRRQAVSWALVAVVVAVAFSIGSLGGGEPPTAAERAEGLASQVACPTCDGESVAESPAPVAANIYAEIVRQVDAGRTDQEILTFLADRYGEETLLRPAATGSASLVWVIPVVAVIVASAALVATFRRWSRDGAPSADDEDRELVERFLADTSVNAGPGRGAIPGLAGSGTGARPIDDSGDDADEGAGR